LKFHTVPLAHRRRILSGLAHMPRPPVIVTLEDPIEAHGETFHQLTIRQPNGNDLVACGIPLNFAADGGSIDVTSVAAMISRLAGIPTNNVGAMGMRDWMACMNAIMGFINPPEASEPAPPQSLTATSTSPGSGELTPAPSLRSVSTS
jgi:hypothetical protein